MENIYTVLPCNTTYIQISPATLSTEEEKIYRRESWCSDDGCVRTSCKREIIETELIANGITSKSEIVVYTDFVLHSYNQVKDWLRTYAEVDIRQRAGL